MNDLQIFKNEEFGEVRTVTINGEPWLVGKDVAAALGYTDLTHCIIDHVDDEDRINSKTHGQNDPEFGQRGTWLINESGLYGLVLGSKLDNAKKFKRWVTSEVLPAIRKTGGYIPINQEDDDMSIMAKALLIADKTIKKKDELLKAQLQQIQEQQKELDYKEDVIIGLVDEVSLADKRQILNRVMRHSHADYQDRWALLYREFDSKYHISVKSRMERYNNNCTDKKAKVKSRLDYIDRVMNKLPELYEIAAKLFHEDVDRLVEQLYGTRV